jgi:hypothetical protein
MSTTTLDITESRMDIESVESINMNINKAVRSWGWAVRNKWAERIKTKSGPAVRCLFLLCSAQYLSKSKTTTGINNHLLKTHHITKDSNVNDRSLSRKGPLDILFGSPSQPRVFDPTKFDDLLVCFIVTTKQPFTIVNSSALQELLNHTTMASLSQVKLPSDDTIGTKVKQILFLIFINYFI